MLSLEYVLKGDFIQGQPDSFCFEEVSFGVSIGKHLVCQNHPHVCLALMCHYLQSVILELDLTALNRQAGSFIAVLFLGQGISRWRFAY
jgi:hypothetical protein